MGNTDMTRKPAASPLCSVTHVFQTPPPSRMLLAAKSRRREVRGPCASSAVSNFFLSHEEILALDGEYMTRGSPKLCVASSSFIFLVIGDKPDMDLGDKVSPSRRIMLPNLVHVTRYVVQAIRFPRRLLSRRSTMCIFLSKKKTRGLSRRPTCFFPQQQLSKRRLRENTTSFRPLTGAYPRANVTLNSGLNGVDHTNNQTKPASALRAASVCIRRRVALDTFTACNVGEARSAK